jgi:tripartite-type tricarboxylate transporter receptor subunit TctC
MNKMARGYEYLVLFILVAGFSWVSPSQAQNYPSGQIQFVVPFPPGGAADIFWRSAGDALSKHLGVPVAIVNKPGGGGVVGVSSVVNSKPDGYNIAGATSDGLNITPLFNKDMPFDITKDLTYIAKMTMFIQCIAVRTESPFKTLDELLAFAKANPKKLKAGTPGVGTHPFMAVHMLNDDAKVQITPVPLAGGGAIVPNVLGGHVDVGFISIPPIKAQVAAGTMRILAILGEKRHPGYSDIPTAVEKGYKKTIVQTGIGIVGPKGLSPEVIKKWQDVAQATLKDPGTLEAVKKFDFVLDYKTGEEFKKELLKEMEYFKKLMAQVEDTK